jgi:2-oxoglutarate dehydrogenase E2 component (dihydrolipoamide succinyltransferase)
MLEKRPLVDAVTGELRIAWAAYLCMTYDHRLIDGADAARFLGALAAELGTDWPWPAGR